jgi:DNA-binding MarR family transcriptional regulator
MPKKHPTHPDRHLGHWMRLIAAHAVHALGRELAAEEVTAAEWPVLRDLFDREEHVSTSGELARGVGVSRGAMSKLVARLAAKGLLDIYEDEMDGRVQVVALSEAGERAVPILAAAADRCDAQLFGHLKPAERSRLLETLQGIAAHHGWKAPPAP